MNQILITKKLYVTPELKRKKKVYKFEFFLSVFFVCILISACIYAEYDRNKSEEVSQEILANLDIPEDTNTTKNDVLVVVLDDKSEQNINNSKVETSPDGYQYRIIATINIPKIDVKYPIIDGPTDSVEETEDLLKISPTKFWGSDPNKIGNCCIVGHNYRNTRFFSKVPTLENGDKIELTDLSGKTLQYVVYNKYEVEPKDVSCTTQKTGGKKEITLITCTDDSKHRVVIKAREIK